MILKKMVLLLLCLAFTTPIHSQIDNCTSTVIIDSIANEDTYYILKAINDVCGCKFTNYSFKQNVIVNLVSSLAFLFVILFAFRPKLRISKKIAKETLDDGSIKYVFKIVNWSLYNAFDVHVSIDERKLIPTPENRFDEELRALYLKRDFFATLPGIKIWDKYKTSSYGLQIYSDLDLDDILKDNRTSILLQITLKHGLTGLAKCYEKTYVKKSIKTGSFADGWSMSIK